MSFLPTLAFAHDAGSVQSEQFSRSNTSVVSLNLTQASPESITTETTSLYFQASKSTIALTATKYRHATVSESYKVKKGAGDGDDGEDIDGADERDIAVDF